MNGHLKVVSGTGNHQDRAADLATAILKAINENGEGMTMAAIIGCLEIVKMELMQEAME